MDSIKSFAKTFWSNVPSLNDITSPLFARKQQRTSPPPQFPRPPPLQPAPPDARDAFAKEASNRVNALPSNFIPNATRASIPWGTPAPGLLSGLPTPAALGHMRTPAWRMSLPKTLRLSSEFPSYAFERRQSQVCVDEPTPMDISTPRPPPFQGLAQHTSERHEYAMRPSPPRRKSETALARSLRETKSRKYEQRHKARKQAARSYPFTPTSRIANGHSFRNNNPFSSKGRLGSVSKQRPFSTTSTPQPNRTNSIPPTQAVELDAGRILASNTNPYPSNFISNRSAEYLSKPPTGNTSAGVALKRPRTAPTKTFATSSLTGNGNNSDKQESNLPRPKAPQAIDVAKLLGISRKQLYQMFTAPLVEMMESNPNFAEKILKKFSADLPHDLRIPGRREERQKKISEKQQHLANIRAKARLHAQQEVHENNVRATALQANGVSDPNKPPPNDAKQFTENYWALDYGDVYEETPDSLNEKETRTTVVEENSPFAPFTEAALRRIRSVLGAESGDPILRQELVNIQGCRIHGSDLQLLRPNTWLNDEVVNAFMELLFQRNQKALKENGEGTTKVRFMNSFFYARLFEYNRAQECHIYNFTRVRRWTRKFDVFELDRLIIPINQGNIHWTLAVVNFEMKQVEHWDSFGGGQSNEILENLLRWVVDEAEHKKQMQLDAGEWRKINMTPKIPQQSNSDDCGVFVCKFADWISRGKKADEITFNAAHMRYFRARIAHEILMSRTV